ncbi:hypothetical protein ASAP_2243 [Asaia bogorensis]|uniref:Uncharacterized protein n=1 Tax=Asaia bogorensis TaxID=91915 RepID=A0A060QHX2_9PROT|nr:hypothetical protein ASAP_2243 [Asaia bogorensis]
MSPSNDFVMRHGRNVTAPSRIMIPFLPALAALHSSSARLLDHKFVMRVNSQLTTD